MPKTVVHKLDISIMNILKIVGVLLGIFLFFKIWEIIAALFFAIVIAAALEPALRWFEKHKIPRIVSVPSIYLLSFTALMGIFYIILPAIFNEVFVLSQDLPLRVNEFVQELSRQGSLGNAGFLVPAIEEFLLNLQDRIGQTVPNLFGFISGIFGGILTFFLVVVLSFYLSLRKNEIEKSILSITHNDYKDSVKSLIRKIQYRTGKWMQMVFVLATFMGVAVFLMMTIIGVDFALTLGILAGFLEIIPYIGPFIAGAIILTMASTKSIGIGLIALGLYVLLQQVEQAFIIPVVMSRVVELNPLAILLSVIIGAELAGFWGILIAIPLVLSVREVLRNVVKHS
ncbi:MAG: AI-2E family transporter [Candidatus Spechtbacterales bacterium]|nr:AI-2E family transporter [Candidatus Spechtbacterales bacterium]